jgi:DNA helicase-2/ATP-dependent DNA helicase PcrA
MPDSADAVLDGLDPEQRAVATALHGPVCVLAGAGTGKTRAITHRIAYGVRAGILQPASVLAVTFTARAAGEMRGRLRQLGAGGVQARTFHSAALRQLQYFWPRAIGGDIPRLLDRKVQLVAEAGARSRIRLDRNELRDVTGEIEWCKVTQTVPEDYAVAAAKTGRDVPRDPAEVARIYTTYEQLKRDRGVIDFEDVLLLTVGVLQDRPDVADTVRSQYQHFVVDEYQDVSPLQQRLLELWLGGRTCAWSATPRRRSTPSPAPPRTSCSASAPGTRTPPWSSSCGTTAPPRRWSAWPTGCWARPAARPRPTGSN